MHTAMRPAAAWTPFIAAALLAIVGNSTLLYAAESARYPETVAVLQMLHGSEVRAQTRYLIFADVALAEGHKPVAHMFRALADSESVHANNFKRILGTLGVSTHPVDTTSIKAGSTKKNLRYATDVELAEIDKEYPRYLGRIKAEGHSEARQYITYAWEAERQHRELIQEIRSGTGIFFGLLLERFREGPEHYYVNQNCGATVHKRPDGPCPICQTPPETYKEIPAP